MANQVANAAPESPLIVEFQVTKTRARPLSTLTGERVTGAVRHGTIVDLALTSVEITTPGGIEIGIPHTGATSRMTDAARCHRSHRRRSAMVAHASGGIWLAPAAEWALHSRCDDAARDGQPCQSAIVIASALLFGMASAGQAARMEAEARAALTADIHLVTAKIDRSVVTGRAVVGAHLLAAVCVAEASSQLAPVASGGERYVSGSFERARTVMQRAAEADPVPAYDPAPPPQPPAGAGVDELEESLASLRSAYAASQAEVDELASAARSAEQGCAEAGATILALVQEVTARTDELLAANSVAGENAIADLSRARDAVAASEEGAVATWIAAASAVEASHAAAVKAEQDAAAAAMAEEAARRAELEATEQTSTSVGPSAEIDWCAIFERSPVVDPVTGEVRTMPGC